MRAFRLLLACALVGSFAAAHARAGDASTITGYLGSAADFDEAIARFAVAYADLNELDHARLVQAVRSGQVPAETG